MFVPLYLINRRTNKERMVICIAASNVAAILLYPWCCNTDIFLYPIHHNKIERIPIKLHSFNPRLMGQSSVDVDVDVSLVMLSRVER